MSDPPQPSESLRSYVRAALHLQGYELEEERVAAVALQFARIEEVARTFLPTDAQDLRWLGVGTAPFFRP